MTKEKRAWSPTDATRARRAMYQAPWCDRQKLSLFTNIVACGNNYHVLHILLCSVKVYISALSLIYNNSSISHTACGAAKRNGTKKLQQLLFVFPLSPTSNKQDNSLHKLCVERRYGAYGLCVYFTMFGICTDMRTVCMCARRPAFVENSCITHSVFCIACNVTASVRNLHAHPWSLPGDMACVLPLATMAASSLSTNN